MSVCNLAPFSLFRMYIQTYLYLPNVVGENEIHCQHFGRNHAKKYANLGFLGVE